MADNKEKKICERLLEKKEDKGELYSVGYIATDHIDKSLDYIPKETLDRWAEQLNSSTTLTPNPLSVHHDVSDTNVSGLGNFAVVESLDGGHFGLKVITHHNKEHPDFKKTAYELDNKFLSHYSIEYSTHAGATTKKENMNGQEVRVLLPDTELLGYGLASPRTVVNPNATIEEVFYKEIINLEKKEPFAGKQGSGDRFKNCVEHMKSKGKNDPEGLCASIGRKKFGGKKMGEMAAAGKEDICDICSISEQELLNLENEYEAEVKMTEQTKEQKESKIDASSISKELLNEIKESIKAELKSLKPENSPAIKPSEKESKSPKDLQFKEAVDRYKETLTSKKADTREKYIAAARLEKSLKERGLIVPDIDAHSSYTHFEIKEGQMYLPSMEFKAAVTTDSDYSGVQTSFITALSNYEQTPARYNDIYSPIIVEHLNTMTTFWNILPKDDMSGNEAIRIRARTAANTAAGSNYGATPAFTTSITMAKLDLHFVTTAVDVKIEDEAIEFARGPGGLGDIYALEIMYSTKDLMTKNNQLLFGSGNGTAENAPIGLLGLIITTGNLYGRDVTASGFTTLAAAGVDNMNSASITLAKMREMADKCIINGAQPTDLKFITSYVQARKIKGLIQSMQGTVPTSGRIGYESFISLDGIEVIPDKDLDALSETDELFLIDIAHTRIGLKKAPTYVEYGKTERARKGQIWMMWNLYSDAPNHNYRAHTFITT